MVAEDRVKAREGLEMFGVEESEICKDRIDAGAGVSLAEHEAVALRPMGALAVDSQKAVIQGNENLGRRKGRTIVAGPRHRDLIQHGKPYVRALLL
jgi:hypothetical protein